MPVELNHLFIQAEAIQGNQQLHVAEDGDLAVGTGLHGLKKLSSSAHRAENQAAVDAFIRSLEAHPAYRALLDEVRAPLDEIRAQGKPLTGAMVKDIKLSLDVTEAVYVGKALADEGKIPPGHGTSFGQFAAVRGLSVDTPQGQAIAVREYLTSEVIPKNLTSLSKLPDLGEQSQLIGRLMNSAHGPVRTFLADTASRMLEGGIEQFSFEAFEGAWQDACADDIALCRQLTPSAMESILSGGKPADTLTTMREALPIIGAENLSVFRQELFSTPSLSTPEARAGAVTDFFLNRDGTALAKPFVTAQGLPESFATAIGHNPTVVAEAKAALAENPGVGVMPTQAQATAAFEGAVTQFLADNAAILHELHIMSENPPVELRPGLTPDNMPRYINTMLAGDAILEVLVNDNTEIDANFMDKLAQHGRAMNSAAHSFRGDFGADDVARVLNNSIRLLLARRGVPNEMLPELASRSLSKFGALASDFASVNDEVQGGRFGMSALLNYLPEGMTLYRSLEGHARALLSLLSDDQRSAIGADAFNTPQAGQTEREIATKQSDFFETHFQNGRPLAQISDVVRHLAEARGIHLPEGVNNPVDAARTQLAENNRQMGETVLGLLVRSSGHAVEKTTEDFRAFFADASRTNDLSLIDLDKLDLTPMSQATMRAVRTYVTEQTQAGLPADPAHCRAVAEEVLLDGLKALQGTLAAIDALPARQGEGFDVIEYSPETKTMMKDMAQRFGLRDANVIGQIANAVSNNGILLAMRELSSPVATPAQLAEVHSKLSDMYRALRMHIPQEIVGGEDIPAMFAAMAIRHSGVSAQNLRHISDNLTSETAQKVAGGFMWLYGEGIGGERTGFSAMAAVQMMNQFRTEAQVALTGNAEVEGIYYNQMALNLREIPGGPNGMVQALSTMSHGSLPKIDAQLAEVSPALSGETWSAVRTAYQHFEAEAESSKIGFLLPTWMADSANEIAAAVAANNGEAPTLSQMWDILTGGELGSLPKSLKKGTMGQLMDAVNQGYQKLLKAAVPDIMEPILVSQLINLAGSHVPVSKLISLAKPGAAEINMTDVHTDLRMSSMRGYDAESGYGLVLDFRRQSSDATLTFRKADGTTMAVHPSWISDDENSADHPTLRDITDFWQGMTQSDAQLRRLGQSFSQASLITARVLSLCFPGVEYSEHGNFAMTAEARDDGSIVVDINTGDQAPVAMHEQFVIHPDGTHDCTAFTMRRAAAH